MAKIYGNTVGASAFPKSYLLETEDGMRLTGVLVDEVKVFDVTPNDVREGKTYAGENGIKIGEKVIPSYNTTEGIKIVTPGSKVEITNIDQRDLYQFTKLQAILCEFNTSMTDSVSASKVSIESGVYEVNSTTLLSTVIPNDVDKTIDFGIINETDNLQILRYFTYKEIY